MSQTKKLFQTIIVSLLLIVAPGFVVYQKVSASQLISFRSVQISSATPGALISETFAFNLISTLDIASISFEHCSNSPLPEIPCVAPTGYDATSRNLTAQTGNTGFSVAPASSTANRFVITRTIGPGVLGNTTYGFTNITNTTLAGQTVFVRIATYASNDGSGTPIDGGSMAFATVAGFSVGAYVPPFLIFCVGVTVGNQCSSAVGSLISFGELSTTQAKSATSQFSGATNDPGGYSVYVDGNTMTAGNQVIPGLAGSSGSSPGTSQFGLNLRANTVPNVGANQTGVGVSTISANYNTPNLYRFVNGEQLTSAPLSTDYNVSTVSYIVNISQAQPPGYYATTMSYIATAAF